MVDEPPVIPLPEIPPVPTAIKRLMEALDDRTREGRVEWGGEPGGGVGTPKEGRAVWGGGRILVRRQRRWRILVRAATRATQGHLCTPSFETLSWRSSWGPALEAGLRSL